MSSASTEGTRDPRPVVGRLQRAYDDMTDGQRWSTALAIAATVLFLAFGLRTVPEPFSLALPASDGSDGSTAVREPGATSTPAASLGSQSGQAASTSTGRRTPVNGGSVAVDEDPEQVPAPATPPASGPESPLSVVALVRDGDSEMGGDDVTIAEVFLRDLGVPVTVIELDAARSDMCSSVTDAGEVVVAGAGLPRDLRDCIVESGASLLSHDQLGSQGVAISTRLGAQEAILEAATWGDAKGTIGIAAAAAVEPEAEAAAAALARRGIDVEVAIVPEGPGNAPEIAGGVIGFSRSGVDTVIFAMPVGDQSVWLGLERVLGFRPAHVVADVADAPANEEYPPEFHGALAVVATKVPWFAREHGETPDQASCRETFEHAVGSPVSDVAELVRVLAWCQHVRLLRDALGATGAVDQVIRGEEASSPLTSRLGVVRGTYGPTEMAVVTWSADCACWATESDFRDRSVEEGR